MTFSGAISGNITWNSYDSIYITGNLTIGTGATLNIAPNTSGSDIGTYIIFTGSYNMVVSSTGALNVSGTSSENIYFTADYPISGHTNPWAGNKTFGESGEVFKNIRFNGSTGTSVIEYAVIEYGGGNSGYGGGFDIVGRYITIKNSSIHDCSVTGVGGGIYVSPAGFNNSITLENLKIYNNTASGNGGGLHIAGSYAISVTGSEIYNNNGNNGDGIYVTNTSCTISNSLIHNHSFGAGIYAYATGSGVSINNCLINNNDAGFYFARAGYAVNCNIVNNTTGVVSGATTAPKLVNDVLWGNGSEYTINTSAQLELGYCGIEGGLTGASGQIDSTHNINLSSTNGATTGPNFVIPSSDFHINSWVTPDVDGGTATYTGVTVPSTDSEGKARIGTIDIGAYEFFYYIWEGDVSSSWSTSGNWTGSPSSVPTSFSENKIIIPKGCTYYPITSSLTLSSRSNLTIEPEAGLEVTGATSVGSGCTFLLKSDASGSANFITGPSVSGSFNIEMFLAGGGDPNFKWHYVMTPVDGHAKATLTTNISNPYNLLNYVESAVVSPDRNTGWQWHDGYNGTSGFTTLYNTSGFNVYVSSDQTAIFTGIILNSDDYTFTDDLITISTLPDPDGIFGWNLIGNPFTSGVDADDLILGSDLGNTIYFTKNNAYLTYNITTHTGTNGASDTIPPLQAFFVKALSDSRDKAVTIPASSRFRTVKSFYKKGGGDNPEFPILKLNVNDGANVTDETIVYFFKDATAQFDGKYDAYKMFSENPVLPQIYTVSNSLNYCMNGITVPAPKTKTVIPLNLRIGEAKNYTINVLDLENLSDYKVYLMHGDNKIDLKSNPSYSFYLSAGTIDNMSLIFDNIIEDVFVPSIEETECWYSNGGIQIKMGLAGFEYNSSVTVYDLNGKIINNKQNLSLPQGERVELPVNLLNGIYIAKISGKGVNITKKIVVTQ
jgi:hypothetical protein